MWTIWDICELLQNSGVSIFPGSTVTLGLSRSCRDGDFIIANSGAQPSGGPTSLPFGGSYATDDAPMRYRQPSETDMYCTGIKTRSALTTAGSARSS
jgi:hypothetical protein